MYLCFDHKNTRKLTWKAVKYSDDSVLSVSVILFRVLYGVLILWIGHNAMIKIHWYIAGNIGCTGKISNLSIKKSLLSDPSWVCFIAIFCINFDRDNFSVITYNMKFAMWRIRDFCQNLEGSGRLEPFRLLCLATCAHFLLWWNFCNFFTDFFVEIFQFSCSLICCFSIYQCFIH